jgi:hypothetical protein
MGIAATVSSAPTNVADTLDLHWLSPRDGADGEEVVRERDLRWVATSQLPAVGDDALLFIDSLGDPWAFVWATGAALNEPIAAVTDVASFTNSWTSVVGRAAGYYADRGRVYLRGGLKSGTSGQAAFTLPSPFWPSFTVEFAAPATGGIAEVVVSSAGVVTPFNVGATTVTTSVFMDGISFRYA